jgi:hypothetical protein
MNKLPLGYSGLWNKRRTATAIYYRRCTAMERTSDGFKRGTSKLSSLRSAAQRMEESFKDLDSANGDFLRFFDKNC